MIEIICRECGKGFTFLPTHLRVKHQMNTASYRERWEIPAGEPLASDGYREAHRAKLGRLVAMGVVVRDPAAASEAARRAERPTKVPQQAAEQSVRVAVHRPGDHSLLPPGAKRADGRDADKAREYQRAYRAQKKQR